VAYSVAVPPGAVIVTVEADGWVSGLPRVELGDSVTVVVCTAVEILYEVIVALLAGTSMYDVIVAVCV